MNKKLSDVLIEAINKDLEKKDLEEREAIIASHLPKTTVEEMKRAVDEALSSTETLDPFPYHQYALHRLMFPVRTARERR